MSNEDYLKALSEDEAKLQELWRTILSYIRRDIAYVYTEQVRNSLNDLEKEAERTIKILKIFRYRVYVEDKKRFETEIFHLTLLINHIEKLDTTKPNKFIRQIHADLMQVIQDLERDRTDAKNLMIGERRKLLNEWGFSLGQYIIVERRLLSEWDKTLKIKQAAEPNFVRVVFRLGLPRCKEFIQNLGLLKVGMDLIKIASESKLENNVTELFVYGLPSNEEAEKIPNLLKYGRDLLKKMKILYDLFLSENGTISESGLQGLIKLAKATESFQKARLYVRLLELWNKKFLVGIIDPQIIRRRKGDFSGLITGLSGHNISPRPLIISVKKTSELMMAFMELYEFSYSVPREYKTGYDFSGFVNGALRIGLRNHSADDTRALTYLCKSYFYSIDRAILYKFLHAVAIYGEHHGLTKESVKSFEENLLPAMINNSHNVGILLRGGNIWAMGKGEFGVGDFTCHCYASKITPLNLNNLLMVAKEVPTTSLARLEQNRKDGLTLSSVFGALRDFIHDQQPLVHETLKAMIEYYDTSNKDKLASLLPLAGGYLGSIDRQNLILDRANYEKEVVETINGQQQPTKAINVLRRLVLNTTAVTGDILSTSDAELNEEMEELQEHLNEENLSTLLDYVNQKLKGMMRRKQVGIEPSLVLNLIWIDQKAMQWIRELTYETQVGVYKKGWLQSILRFQELTNSPTSYNERDFQKFLQKVTGAKSDVHAFRLIGTRILNNINLLARKYKASNRGHMTGALWSGNLTHELIGLSDLKPAATEYGRRHREEQMTPEWMRRTGD